MNKQFDELTKQMAQSVTRRAALKKFGVGLASMALACFGLPNKARATTISGYCQAQPKPSWPPGTKVNNKWVATGFCFGVDPVTGTCFGAGSGTCPSGDITPGHVADAYADCAGWMVKGAACSFTI